MNSPSHPLPRVVSIFIALGVVGSVFLVSLPFMIASAFEREEIRHNNCMTHARYDCEPSMIWVLRGWTNADSATTTASNAGAVASSTATGAATSTAAAPEALELVASSSTAASAPLLLKFSSPDLQRSGDVYRAKAGASIKLHIETQGTKELVVRPAAGSPTIFFLKMKPADVFEGTIKLPTSLPTTVELLLKNGADVWTAYNLHIASNQ